MNKTFFCSKNWHFMVSMQVLLALALLSVSFETAWAKAITPEIPAVSDNENELMVPQDEREEYVDLYYPWNKISTREVDANPGMMPAIVFFANSAMMEELTNGDNADMNDDSILNQKRGWKKMSVAWGKRRNAGQYMNRATGSWGKREPNWNNLKGMWGKRSGSNKRTTTQSSQHWNDFRGSWGKRALNALENK